MNYSNYDISAALKDNSIYIEKVLDEYLSGKVIGSGTLRDAMRYAVLGGGKRIRAFLTMKVGEMLGADRDACAPFAASIEMIHAYSLIHDDLPCMDNDDMRRGKPSCHNAFGEAEALLAGDALLSLAFQIAAGNNKVHPRSAAMTAAEYGRLSGALGMAGGQMIDLSGSAGTYSELCDMYSKKTGALICAALAAGCYASSPEPDEKVLEAVNKYGISLGLAFQIQDDVLDVIGNEAELGKPVGSDSRNDKHTCLAYMSADAAMKESERMTEEAVTAVSAIPGSEPLCALAYYLCRRTS